MSDLLINSHQIFFMGYVRDVDKVHSKIIKNNSQ